MWAQNQEVTTIASSPAVTRAQGIPDRSWPFLLSWDLRLPHSQDELTSLDTEEADVIAGDPVGAKSKPAWLAVPENSPILLITRIWCGA